jgi:hypothetical protein
MQNDKKTEKFRKRERDHTDNITGTVDKPLLTVVTRKQTTVSSYR